MIERGVTRTVFVFSKFVIKIPTLRFNHTMFLHGMLANWNEWDKYKNARYANKKYLCPVIWCSWFGIIQIMKRASVNSTNPDLLKRFFATKGAHYDCGYNNVGILNKKPVIVDYGDFEFYID